MKQSAIELLMESILGKDFRLTCSDEQLNAYQQAKQMESEQRKELSDEEIEKVAERFEQHEFYGAGRVFIKGAIWYREQLKQRQ